MVMQNIEYLLTGSRYVDPMRREGTGNRHPPPVGETTNEALTL